MNELKHEMFADSEVEEEEEIESIGKIATTVRWATFLVAGVLWIVAGNGQKTNANCGKYSHVKICDNVDLHGRMTLDGKNYTGKIFRRLFIIPAVVHLVQNAIFLGLLEQLEKWLLF